MQFIHGLRFNNIKGDIYGGLTVAVVALPLSVAFGVASGFGPAAGLYAAIFLGFFASLFGGSPAQVSGPTGPMTVIMASIAVTYHDNPEIAFTVVILAGIFQIIFGVLKLGQYISLMPFPVVSGFMSGVGCIIIILQILPFIGTSLPSDQLTTAVNECVRESGETSQTVRILSFLPQAFNQINLDALTAGLISLVIAMFTPGKIRKLVPAPLIALTVGTLAVYFFLKDAPVIGEIPSGLPKLHIPAFPEISFQAFYNMIWFALVLAIIGSIDSLLTATIADSMIRATHHSNKELVGQGIGQIVAGMFGGIAGCGAAMRTSVNIQAGGRTPLSGALHSMILLAVLLELGSLASHIPHSVLAGILIKVGIDIIDWGYIKKFRRAPKAGVIFMITVMLLTVFVNLMVAVAAGMVLASLLLVKRMADIGLTNLKEIREEHEDPSLGNEEKEILKRHKGRVMLFRMSGPMSFGAAQGVARRFSAADKYDAMIIDLTHVTMMDSSTALMFEDVISQSQERNKYVFLVGLKSNIRNILHKLGVLELIPPGHVNKTILEALQNCEKEMSGK